MTRSERSPRRKVGVKKKAKSPIARRRRSAAPSPRATSSGSTVLPSVDDALAWLEKQGSPAGIESHTRYGIDAPHAFGVSVGSIKTYAKKLGRQPELARALWESGWYEARLLAGFVHDPEHLTLREMNQWANDFDNWAIVDTVCFHLFDRSPYAWAKVRQWAKARPEFKKRAAFALLWSLSVHDKEANDDAFLDCFPLIETAATDERHFVKKAVDMSLRAIGKRNRTLHAAALELADQLAESDDPTARWIGSHAGRELKKTGPRRRAGSKETPSAKRLRKRKR